MGPAAVKAIAKLALGRMGLRIVRNNAWRGAYISAEDTIQAAVAMGVTVPDYVARMWGDGDTVKSTIATLRSAIPLTSCQRMLEIGTGTCRFLELALAAFRPGSCEIYETDPAWANYATEKHGTIKRAANGSDLRATPSASCDIVFAHCVFVYAPFVTNLLYFREIRRVLRAGGYAAFDVILSDTCTMDVIDQWLSHPHIQFQRPIPRQVVVADFEANGCEIIREFKGSVPSGDGQFSIVTHYLVFRKSS